MKLKTGVKQTKCKLLQYQKGAEGENFLSYFFVRHDNDAYTYTSRVDMLTIMSNNAVNLILVNILKKSDLN